MHHRRKGKGNLVAVYGSLKKGLGNHVCLGKSKQVGEYIAKGFSMYSLGAYPAVVESINDDKVLTEVYEVDRATFKRLDALEGYPFFYNRKLISTPHGNAWIYYFVNKDGLGSRPQVLPTKGREYATWKD